MMFQAFPAAAARRCKALWADRRGNFAVLTALAALPVMFTIGGMVDLNMYYANRTKVQNATDAAALAAAKRFPFDPDETRLKGFAQDYFDANTGELFRTETALHYRGTRFNENNVRELTLCADLSYDALFLPLMSQDLAGIAGSVSEVCSVIAIGNTTVEMALVLDTSGSMNDVPAGGGGSKISNLRRVASDAIDDLFAASEMAGVEDPVRVSVVPFAGAVNLGVPLDTWWLDPKGIHPNHHDHLDWAKYNYTTLPDNYGEGTTDWSNVKYAANQIAVRDPASSLAQDDRPWILKGSNPAIYLTRQYLLRNIGNTSISWNERSCPRGYGWTNCTSSQAGNGLWTVNGQSGGRGVSCTQSMNASSANSTCHPPYTLTRTSQFFMQSTTANPRVCAETRSGPYALTDQLPNENDPASMFLPYFAPDEYDHSLNFGNNYLRDRNSSYWVHVLGKDVTPLNGINWQVAQRDVRKYLMNPRRINNDLGTNNARSPYYICESDPIVPLANTAATPRAAVQRLAASGSTNVEEGIGWGWRTLTEAEPFAGGRANGDENNYKALVVMTDGANTYYPNYSENVTGFGAYGFSGDKRIFQHTNLNPNASSSHSSSKLTEAMDQRTARLCENVKDDGRVPVTTVRGDPILDAGGNPISRDGIIVYTIAFDIPRADKPRVEALLKNCASAHISDQRLGLPESESRKYTYSASSNADLERVFDEIIASLSSLRIAR